MTGRNKQKVVMGIKPSDVFTTILILIMLTSIGHPTLGQNKNILGAIVGMNVSRVSDYDGKTSVGLTSGLYWEWKFSDSFSLQSNFLYAQKGEREDHTTPELRLHYLNLPIMVKHYLTDDLQVMTGIYWDLLLGIDGQTHSKDDFKKSDFGIPIGVSYELFNQIQLGLSFNVGLSNISDNTTQNFEPRNTWGNVTMAFLLK